MEKQNDSKQPEEDVAKAMNDLARHSMILKIYKDILVDIQVCELEGWDPLEYIHILQKVLNHFKKRNGQDSNNNRHDKPDSR